MSGNFEITIDSARNLLCVRMWGFFSVADTARYVAAVETASTRLSPPVASQRMLCDVSEMRIQPQEVVAAFRRFMADPRFQARRVAFVADRSLARMQLQRVSQGRISAIFMTAAEAEAWLFAAPRASAARRAAG